LHNEGVEILSASTYPFTVLAWIKERSASPTISFEYRVSVLFHFNEIRFFVDKL